MSAFDPEGFFDRTVEQALFDGILSFQDDARVITIKDEKDTGKSELLRSLRHKCTYGTKTAVCLVALDELDRVHKTVRHIVKALERHGLEFATFNDVERRRLDNRAPAQIHIEGKLEAGQISGEGKAVEIGTINVDNSGLDDDAQEELRDEAVSAFEDDLRALATERPVVLLFDAYEQLSQELEEWLPQLLEQRVFDPDKRARKLVVVIAGQRVPTKTLKMILQHRYDGVVTPIEPLSVWDREHVEAFLDHSFKGQYDDEDVDWICAKLKKGWTIGRATDVLMPPGANGDG